MFERILTAAALMLSGALFATAGFNSVTAAPPVAPATNLICNKCVNGKDIANKAVKSSKINTGAVTTGKIKNKAVTPQKLATPDGVAFTPTTVFDSTITATQTLRTLTITLPGPGSVIVFASGYYRMTQANTQGTCSITKGAVVDNDFDMRFGGVGSPATNHRVPFAGTRGYDEAAGGPVTYNLVCEEITGSFGVFDIVMTAIYSATNITTGFTPP